MQDIGTAERVIEVFVDHVEQIIGFAFSDRDLGRVTGVFAVSGADQGEAFQVRNGEDYALVFVLQDVGMLAVIQSWHDQVAALDQPNAVRRVELEVIFNELGHPWAGRIDQGAGTD
ncbi:hypothetical protein D3C78_1267470 [compost metagenome]